MVDDDNIRDRICDEQKAFIKTNKREAEAIRISSQALSQFTNLTLDQVGGKTLYNEIQTDPEKAIFGGEPIFGLKVIKDDTIDGDFELE